jgi:nitrogen PTS system EIIA component
MDLSDLLTPESVIAQLKAANKKQALGELAARAARLIDMDERTILDTLLERERLGTTGVGHGIAIPHGKLAGLKRLHGFFARLEQPIDFDAIDGLPVDLIFVLLAPESAGADHLKALARISRLMRNAPMCEQLRATDNADALYALLTGSTASHAA